MDLQAAKVILAEVFIVRIKEMDEMIQNQFEATSPVELRLLQFISFEKGAARILTFYAYISNN
jgi:hypothetical protein